MATTSKQSRTKRRPPGPAKVKAMSRLAERIDAEEKSQLIEQAREVFRRHHAIRQIVSALKAEREAQGLSLADIDARTGIGRSNLCRLENATSANPTIETLQRYAAALDKQILVTLADADPASPARRRKTG